MVRDTAVIIYYDQRAKYSIHALTAVIDSLNIADVYLIEKTSGFLEFVKNISEKYRKCIIGLSIQTTMLADDSYLDFVIKLNKHKGKCISIAGGPHPSGDPIGTIKSLGFDYAFIGESEKTIQDFIYAFVNDDDLLNVKGLFTIVDDKPIYTGKQEPIKLDDYPPFPYWRLLFNPIEISRGCPYGCKYCQVSYMHGFYMRHRSIDNIVEYTGYMIRKNVRDIRFISPDSLAYGLKTISRKPRLDLIEELLFRLYKKYVEKKNARIFYGSFPSEVRPEHLTRDAARILRKYVANKNIILGAQTGSNRLLRLIGRKHSIEDVYSAVENAVKYGFIPNVDYIIGLPGETREDLYETLRSIKKLVSIGARIHLHVFLPLPGSPYAWMPPGKVPSWVKKELMKLIGAGKAYGQWVHQEKLALKIDMLRRRGIIMPRIRAGSMQRPVSTHLNYSVPP
ncbi:Radical SAM domain protein [Staphylothermus marinus F1]|uniref:Radical SAM domain protein n=1 Tax=Staphylothermus marinus (strain ATCC 43588 / DSM 3639 / JCM 9404 / F1) TaxID=399550 RepID=A3DLX5_STAMF|nr:TIGR04013 family B12-binding domain/radical SAM domain-containing protein [Staphylothermus marinus]ABN69635.1 Radical SAM domain protein [Staphylothermus marinus F1]